MRFRGAILFIGLLIGCSSHSPVTVSISPQTAYVRAGQRKLLIARVTDGSGVEWSVNGVVGGTPSSGTIDTKGAIVYYSAPSVTQNLTVTVTAVSTRYSQRSASATVWVVAPGVVTGTKNPQVALYTITPPADADVSIDFGPGTNYGRRTWMRQTPPGGGPVSIYVAGMLPNTLYHMRAEVRFAQNSVVQDEDHTFTTGSWPAADLPSLTAETTPGAAPQSGAELLDLFGLAQTTHLGVVITDLAGNILWGYGPGLTTANPVKLMPNGHLLMNYSRGAPDGSGSMIREVDLGGNTVWQMTLADLNRALSVADCAGCDITVDNTNHDFALLPNGHIVLIAGMAKIETGLTGYPDPVKVIGNVLIDLDQKHNPVWVWSEFDHLDVNRHPMRFPDWTHTNAVVYSPDDGDLIVSMRHQHWIIKIDYDDGKGTGKILWKLGHQGDFTLKGGTDPVDWFYAQHDANISSINSSGVFQMMMFDNGDNRVLDSNGDICGSGSTKPCWSRVPILQLDEVAKTATIEWVDSLAPTYSSWGGNGRLLANGDVEFDECGLPSASAIYEVTRTTPPATVWQMHISGQNAYRAFRIPSLYPGVQW